TWTVRDVLLYHLSLGAGRRGDPELRRTYEKDLQVLPTFAMVAGHGPSSGSRKATPLAMPGVDVDLDRLLHAGQELTLHRQLPPEGVATLTTRVADVWDRQRAAVVVLEHSAADDEGPLWTSRMQIWARGEGGFGGSTGPKEAAQVPQRTPDHVIDSVTTRDQALLYRLNGDLNPLHVDPDFASAMGFDSPILHGLASYGIVAGAVVDAVLDGDVRRLRRLGVRFAGTLVPGETLRPRVWRDGSELVLLVTCPERDDAVVLSHARAGTGD
ncbi:MAG: MaoC family dehydratase N-terminal domain-containing protein, partial [Nocardioides sp.]|nr:MaoC family dehydratase N-terminal domain-containing protein [Nocardioides sp.]